MNFLTINPDFISFGSFSIKWYAVLILSGAIIAMLLSDYEAKHKQLPKDYMMDLLFYAMPIGIVGARLYYVLFKFEDYQANLLKVFYVWEGGLAIYGGLIAGVGVVYWYSKKNRVPFLLTLDIIAPTVLLAQGIGRWGNFVNQEAFGAVVEKSVLESMLLPDWIINQMFINGAYHHPTFLYESVLNILGFIVLYSIRYFNKKLKIGDTTLHYIMWYGLSRFFVEGMRTDSLWFGPLRVSQALSLVLIVASVIMYVYRYNKEKIYYHLYDYNQNKIN